MKNELDNFLTPSVPNRQNSIRQSKDRANLKIALSFDNELIKSTKVIRRKTVMVSDVNIRRIKSQSNMKIDQPNNYKSFEKESNNEEEYTCDSDDDDDSSDYNSKFSESSESDSDNSVNSVDLSNRLSRSASINKPTVKRNTNYLKKPRKSISVPTRTALNEAVDASAVTRGKLHVASVPDDFPCREEEFMNIYDFLIENISQKSATSSCMFISGVPGTGKTATVMGAISLMEEQQQCMSLLPFRKVIINAMHVTEPRQVYLLIYQTLTDGNGGKKVKQSQAVAALERELFIGKKTRPPVLIVIDEIDQLCNRNHDVLYKIFGWLKRKDSRLVLLTISNTMDLANRVLQHKVASRLGVTRLAFEPYSPQQLVQIITARMTRQELEARFDPKAIELAARKVAALSGDARRALDICRRAISLQKGDNKVDVACINAVIKEMYSSLNIIAIRRCCSFYEKLFLKAVVATFKGQGFEEAMLQDVMNQLDTMCKTESVTVLNYSQLFAVLSSLCGYKLLTHDSINNDIRLKLRLLCSPQDVLFALDDSI